ncbi:uncharacterized protein LOC115771338 isoform X2 [Drosophila novamexicana]|uniref:uncharacterized protein LOC115771338 isoform X2 n=1 Tax=Drosophila novamexicana TaxID=47314 RepID=UPI0011E5949E|nr:uncharacterized protein LOC115771338 isoform X2 [Drosophila novamexicana]
MRFFSMVALLLLLVVMLLLGQGYGRNLPVRMRAHRQTTGKAFPHFFQLVLNIMSSLHQIES